MWHHSAHQCGFLGGGRLTLLDNWIDLQNSGEFPLSWKPRDCFLQKVWEKIHKAKNVHDFNQRFQIHIYDFHVCIYIIINIYTYIGVSKNGWWKSWKTLLEWMIWGKTHYFRKHTYASRRMDPCFDWNPNDLEPKWPLFWLEKTLFWRVQPPK